MNTDSKPWYKQFWPWFIIAVPVSSMVMGVIMITLAMDGEDSLVRKNWYKDGMAINQRVDKQNKAKELGIQAYFTLKPGSQDLLIDMDNLDLANQPELIVELMHPTLEQRDRSIKLYLTPGQQYYAKLDTLPHGMFYILVKTADSPWELEGRINFSNPLEKHPLIPNG